jgi:peptide/nickel transport system permease protein
MPLSAAIGVFITALFSLAALFAPLIAPYGMAQIVGGVWKPVSAKHGPGTGNIGAIS